MQVMTGSNPGCGQNFGRSIFIGGGEGEKEGRLLEKNMFWYSQLGGVL